jgi:NADH-quinone oxidoreductase subunit N
MELNFINSLQYIKPEIAITAVIFLIVLVDLIWQKNKAALPWLSLAGLIVTSYYVIEQFDMNASAFIANGTMGMITADSFGAFFKLLVILSSVIIIFFSLTSNEVKAALDRHGEYYTLIFGMILGMFFMISASDLILVYLSLELVSLSSYILAGFTKESLRNSEASLKYIIYGGVASGIMLFGISIIYGLTGTTNLYMLNDLLPSIQVQMQSGFIFYLACILIFAGIGFKISAAPFHFWTPDVYEGAPITITAYLSIASKAAGFALLIRFIKVTFIESVDISGYWILLNLIDWKSFLILISILTMTLGNFAALWQSNMKRLLAYSSIAHAGYLLLGLAVLSDQGLVAILIYFAVYAFMNLGAFFVVMLIANKLGSEEIEDYKGLGYRMPLLGFSIAVFLISLTGIPPTAGFIAKLYLFIALVDANMIAVAVIALLNTVVSLYYYIKVLKNMYLVRPETELPKFSLSPASFAMLMVLLIPILVFGVYFTPLVNFAKNSIALMGF